MALTLEDLDGAAIDQAAALVAREQVQARTRRPGTPASYTDPDRCRVALDGLLVDGCVGFVAHDERRCVGVMCGRRIDTVGFVPAHGLAVDPDVADATAVVVGLLTQLAPVLLRDGASRFTIDHVDLQPLGTALGDAGFGRGSVFATQPTRPAEPAADVDVRIGTADDLDAISALSNVEFAHRSTPPIYAHPQSRTLADARALHEQLLAEGVEGAGEPSLEQGGDSVHAGEHDVSRVRGVNQAGRLVEVAELGDRWVDRPAVGAHGRAGGDDIGDEAADRAGCDDALVAQPYPSQATLLVQFDSDRHDRLAARAGLATCVFATSDEGLVDLDNSAEQFAVGAHHRPSKLVHPRPRRLVGAEPEDSLQPESGDAVLL